MSFKPKSILVTGGAGFIGSHFIDLLLSKNENYRVVNIDNLGFASNLSNIKQCENFSNYQFFEGDISDSHLIINVLKDFRIDTIVNFAAESHVDRSIDSPGGFIQSNIVGTFSLLEAAKHYWQNDLGLSQDECRFCQISTDEVFGSLNETEPAFTETSAYNPSSPYSASKASADHLVNAYAKTYQLPIAITYCSNNYGPRQHVEKFIPTIIRHCLAQTPIPVYGDGKNTRDWLHVQDHCSAIFTVMTESANGERFNIAAGQEMDNLTLAIKICRIFDLLQPIQSKYESLISFVKDRPGHDKRYSIDDCKIRTQLKSQPTTTFDVGLRETINWYLNNQNYLN